MGTRIAALFCTLLLGGGLLVSAGGAAHGLLPERSGSELDDSGDGPIPQRDFTYAEVHVDPNVGEADGTIDFVAQPDATTNATWLVHLGNVDSSGICQATTLVSGNTDGADRTTRVRPVASTPGAASPATRRTHRGLPGASGDGAPSISFQATADALAQQFDCFWTSLASGTAPGATVYDDSESYSDLSDDSPAELYAGADAVRLKYDHWKTLTFSVANDGGSTARQVRAKFPKKSWLKYRKRSVSLPDIAPNSSVKGTVTVKMRKRGRRYVDFTVRAANAAADSTTWPLEVMPKPPKATASLAGHYWWGFTVVAGSGWNNHGIFFVSRRFAYRGFPRHGLPHCHKVTAKVDGDGCVRYWYDRKRNVLQVDVDRGKGLKHGRRGVILDGRSYPDKLVMAKPGSRYQVDLVHKDFSGCPGPACTAWQIGLVLHRDGAFGWGAKTGSSYVVGKRGTITFHESDGKTETSTLWLQTKHGKPSPSKAGVFVGAVNFYR